MKRFVANLLTDGLKQYRIQISNVTNVKFAIMLEAETMCKIYGYCRISRKEQNIERQVRNITAAYPNAVIFQEAFTGTKIEGREKLDKILKTVKDGDTIVFDSVSRMSRNAEEGFKLYQDLFNRGINLKFLKEGYIDSDVYREALKRQLPAVTTGDAAMDKCFNAILSALNEYQMYLARQQIEIAFEQAQKEVDDLHQRTKEGIETARINGKQIGNVSGVKLATKKSIAAKQTIRQHSKDFNGTLSDADVMKLTGLARNTYYKYKREIKEEATE